MQRAFSICLILSACLAFAPGSARAQSGPTFNLLYTFKAQGGSPGALVEVQPGRFFGLTGVAPGIFSITSARDYQFFYTFPTLPAGVGTFGLTPALNGQVYGSASSFAAATLSELFSVAPNAKVTTYPYNPTTQATPALPEIQSPYGLYAIFFSTNSGWTFDRLNYQGNPTVLYTFPKTNGYISGVPFLGLDGAFYGIMLTNNTTNAGIFRLTASGAFSWLVPSFPTGGVNNPIGLIQASNGNFYGTLPSGGSAGAGSIYEITTAGQMTTLYQFPTRTFGIPETLLEASDGMIYGTARGIWGGGYSSIFQLNPYTGQVKTVYSFPNGGVTGECDCSIVQGSDGKFYGAASGEGTYQLGTLFSLDLGLPPPKPHVGLIEPSAEAPGKWVLLWGASLLGTTAVSFNGTPATSFAVASSQGVLAEVPNGATSGPITITTPHGTSTSKQSFTVE